MQIGSLTNNKANIYSVQHPAQGSTTIIGKKDGTLPSDTLKVSHGLGTSDTVDISQAEQALKNHTENSAVTAGVHFFGEGVSRKLRFTDAGTLHQAVKDGFVDIGGQHYLLSDDMKKTLTAQDKAMQKLRQGVANANMLQQQSVQIQRQGESMRKSSQKESRVMQTVMRIMHGRKVSMRDEKELAETSPDLYSLAKSIAAIKQHSHSSKEEEEDNKISKQNDKDREWEASPSSIPDAVDQPVPEYEVDISMPESSVDIKA